MATPQEPIKPPIKEESSSKPTMFGSIVELFQSNMGDTIAYIILAISLVYSFFEPFLGTLPVGFILGLYFSAYSFTLARQFKDFLVKEGIFRGFILVASCAALIISAPGLSLGLLVGAFTRPLFGKSLENEEKEEKE